MKNNQKIELILEDLAQWVSGNDSDDSIIYAFNNGYHIHAANLWLSSGACNEEVLEKTEGVRISKRKELVEIKKLCGEAYIYECQSCHHHGFHDMNEGPVITCYACGGESLRTNRGNG